MSTAGVDGAVDRTGTSARDRSVYPAVRADAPLVVFDFDHTLYDGDSGTHLFAWLIKRAAWRRVLALLLAPVFAPLIAFLPTRRFGISAFVWAGSLGIRDAAGFNAAIDRYVASHVDTIQRRLLPVALEVLHRHREAGDRVVVATGAPPELARAILAFVAHEDVPVVGTEVVPRLGGIGPRRHCHNEMKLVMLHEAGYREPIARAYTDSSADLPLLLAARAPVVVNPKPGRVAMFQRVLPAGTPILNWGCPGRGGEPAAPAPGR